MSRPGEELVASRGQGLGLLPNSVCSSGQPATEDELPPEWPNGRGADLGTLVHRLRSALCPSLLACRPVISLPGPTGGSLPSQIPTFAFTPIFMPAMLSVSVVFIFHSRRHEVWLPLRALSVSQCMQGRGGWGSRGRTMPAMGVI